MIATSHIGGFTEESVDRATAIAIANLVAALNDAPSRDRRTRRAPFRTARWRPGWQLLAGETTSLYWLGQAGFVLDIGAHRLLIDPYLSDSLAAKYAGTAIRTSG